MQSNCLDDVAAQKPLVEYKHMQLPTPMSPADRPLARGARRKASLHITNLRDMSSVFHVFMGHPVDLYFKVVDVLFLKRLAPLACNFTCATELWDRRTSGESRILACCSQNRFVVLAWSYSATYENRLCEIGLTILRGMFEFIPASLRSAFFTCSPRIHFRRNVATTSVSAFTAPLLRETLLKMGPASTCGDQL